MRVLTAALLTFVVAACAGPEPQTDTPRAAQATTSAATEPSLTTATTLEAATPAPPAETSGYPSGNRYVPGVLGLAQAPIRIALESNALWVAGLEDAGGLVVAVASGDGTLTISRIDGGALTELAAHDWNPATPPVLFRDANDAKLVVPADGSSPLTAPARVDGNTVWISHDGELDGADDAPSGPFLDDSRIVVSKTGLVAILSEPTSEYGHGVLGDSTEAASVTVIDGTAELTIDAPVGTVLEAIAPLWGDVDEDGDDELLLTASDAFDGARLVVYEADGTIVATSPPIGNGNRWLNQLAVAPTGPDGRTEITEVRTPHIGGIVRWHRLVDGEFELAAEARSYKTHSIGSRNVDQGAAVDVTGDGAPEILVPTQDQTTLVALGHVGVETRRAAEVALGARLTSNLELVGRSDGTVSLILGTEKELLIWE